MKDINQLSLFTERARSSHPETSHRRAAELNGSIRLTKMMMFALRYVWNNEGLSAPQMRDRLVKGDRPMEEALAPQKCMSRLVKAGWVRRVDGGRALQCYITEEGKKALNGH